ncbi:hypothetical protein HMPREF1249_1210 [Jonquetella sp. BV3C21]|nr:hypothetical protein HMPREF1249_1210 [Jonquetella sp. BV3C21]
MGLFFVGGPMVLLGRGSSPRFTPKLSGRGMKRDSAKFSLRV